MVANMDLFDPYDDKHRPWLALRYPDKAEAERMKRGALRGYMESRNQVVPLDDWKEGQVLDIPNGTESNQRSIARMASKSGFKVTSRFLGGDLYFLMLSRTGGAAPRKQNTTLFLRPWDRAMSKPQLEKAKRIRESPTGVERKVKTIMRGTEAVKIYPWAEMKEGDFFVVPMRYGDEFERRSYKNTFRAAACRYDYEIQVLSWLVNVRGEEKKGLRVTMVQHGLAELKRKAAEMRGERPVISKGRKKVVRNVRQETLDRKAIAALVAAGIAADVAKRMVEEAQRDEGREGGVAVSTLQEGNGRGGSPARASDEWDSQPDDEGSGTPSQGDAENIPDVRDDTSAGIPDEDDDDGGIIDLFEGRFNPEPPAPKPTSRGPRIWADDEVREFSTEGVDPSRLTGALAPDYDRAAIMKERLARAAKEL